MWTGLLPQLEAWTDNSALYDVAVNLGINTDNLPLNRAAAMRVPAMARARNLTCGAVAALPFEAYRGDALVSSQPYWAYGTDGQLGTLTREKAIAWGTHLPQTLHHRAPVDGGRSAVLRRIDVDHHRPARPFGVPLEDASPPVRFVGGPVQR